jgi:precorrin-6x reductase
MAIALTWVGIDYTSPYAVMSISAMAVFLCTAMGISYCSFVFVRLEHPDASRGRNLALAGIVATLVWAMLVMYYASYVDQQLT